jgi:hypothetical protein
VGLASIQDEVSSKLEQLVARIQVHLDICRDRSAFDHNPLKLWALMANKSTLSPYENR